MSYDHEFFKQLTSEKVQVRFSHGHPIREWHKPPGVRNEALDRRAYALAVLYARTVPWEILARSAPPEPPTPPDRGAPSASNSRAALAAAPTTKRIVHRPTRFRMR
jgi:phage terminase large subunit GpA-like protein